MTEQTNAAPYQGFHALTEREVNYINQLLDSLGDMTRVAELEMKARGITDPHDMKQGEITSILHTIHDIVAEIAEQGGTDNELVFKIVVLGLRGVRIVEELGVPLGAAPN